MSNDSLIACRSPSPRRGTPSKSKTSSARRRSLAAQRAARARARNAAAAAAAAARQASPSGEEQVYGVLQAQTRDLYKRVHPAVLVSSCQQSIMHTITVSQAKSTQVFVTHTYHTKHICMCMVLSSSRRGLSCLACCLQEMLHRAHDTGNCFHVFAMLAWRAGQSWLHWPHRHAPRSAPA